MRSEPGDVLAGEADAPAPRADDAHDREQRRGLARAVPADQRDHLALAHRERDALQDVRLAVVGVEILDLEEHHQERAAPR